MIKSSIPWRREIIANEGPSLTKSSSVQVHPARRLSHQQLPFIITSVQNTTLSESLESENIDILQIVSLFNFISHDIHHKSKSD